MAVKIADLIKCFINNYFGSRNLGLAKITIDGISTSAQIKQVVMEITTSPPKKRRGSKFERVSAKNPTITESALIIIPFPVVIRV